MIRRFIQFTLLTVLLSMLAVQAQQGDLKTSAADKIELGTGVSGEVDFINVKVGEQVKQGDLLLALDDTPFKARLKLSSADLGWLKAELEEAEREYARNLELYDDGSLSNVDLELSQIARNRAIAHYNKQLAHQTLAEYDLRQSRIVAPFDGIVLEVRAQRGQRIVVEQQAQTLLVLGRDH